jgi:hypothetical protein
MGHRKGALAEKVGTLSNRFCSRVGEMQNFYYGRSQEATSNFVVIDDTDRELRKSFCQTPRASAPDDVLPMLW